MVFFVLAILVAINALYVAAEFAAVGVRRGRIRQLAGDGNRAAALLWTYLENPQRLDRYIAACQVGITISSLVLGAYGQAVLPSMMAPAFEQLGGMQSAAAATVSAVVVLLGLTAIQMVVGELVPKSLALQFPTPTALRTVRALQWSLRLLSGFITFLNGSGNLVLRLFGVPQATHHHIHSPEEIDLIIAESRDGGLLEPDEQHRLHQALQVSMQSAEQLMIPRPDMKALNADASPEEVLKCLRESASTRLPVYRGSLDNVIGVLHTKDVLAYYLEHGKIPAADDVLRPMAAVFEKVNGDRVLHLMKEKRSTQALVVDEYGGVSGIITIGGILNKVFDPSWSSEAGLLHARRLPDGRYRLPGTMRLDEAERYLGVRWTGRAHTLGGMVLDALGRIPEEGSKALIEGVQIEVERMKNRKIVSVLVTPAAKPEENPEGRAEPEENSPDHAAGEHGTSEVPTTKRSDR